jgi:putative protease
LYRLPKILAPAGSFETLQAVLDSHADEVYIGGKAFSARQNATNFTDDEIRLSAEKCHLYGAKLHVAVNTLISDEQVDEFAEYVKMLSKAKVDALIVQDLGALEVIKAVAPNMELHASTQMSVHSVNGALYLKSLGFKRVVLSRELDRETIREITQLGIDTEIFVHGALCMSVSGQCYLSAMIGSRSANRGLCGQPCRLPCSACGDKSYSALSLKDLSLLEHAQDFIDMGITSLKIEGRMKRPEYSACATQNLYSALHGFPVDTYTLKSVFSRGGFTDGYYTSQRENMFGVRTKEDVTSAEDVLPKVRESYKDTLKVSKLNFSMELSEGMPTMLSAVDEFDSYTVYGDIPQVAINKPTDKAIAERQLSKLGGTIYEFGGLNFYSDGNLVLPVSKINELRRELISKVDFDRIQRNEPVTYTNNIEFKLPIKVETSSHRELRLKLRNFKQLDGLNLDGIQYIIMPMEEILKQQSISKDIVEKLMVEPPHFIVKESKVLEQLNSVHNLGVRHLLCNNLAYIRLGQSLSYTLHGDFGLNVFNSVTIERLKNSQFEDCVVSFELKFTQIEKLQKTIPIGVMAYGKLPLMLVRNCPIQNEVGCNKCKHYISDRTNRNLPVYCSNGKQYAEVFNAETLSIADKLDTLHNVDFYVLTFLDETSTEISKVVESFKRREKLGTTKGLYVRGVM